MTITPGDIVRIKGCRDSATVETVCPHSGLAGLTRDGIRFVAYLADLTPDDGFSPHGSGPAPVEVRAGSAQ